MTESMKAAKAGKAALGVALLYGLACSLSLWMADRPGQVATLWFANPIGTVALMKAPLAAWPMLLAGLGVANTLANAGHGLAGLQVLAQPGAWPLEAWLGALAFVPGNLCEMLLGALALRHCRPDASTFTDPLALGRCLLMGAVLPVLPGSIAGAMFLSWSHGGDWRAHLVTWLSGSVIGAGAVLPLALVVAVLGPSRVWQALATPRTALALVATMGLSAMAYSSLPYPFVAVSLALALMSLLVGIEAMATLTVAVAVLQALIIREGVLLPPPSTGWWDDSLFYSAVLQSLMPGVLLSAARAGRESTIARLQESQQRLRSLYAETPVMLHSVDTDGRILHVSRRWLECLGYREENVLGRPLTDFLSPESARQASEVWLPASKRDGGARDVPYRMRRRDGSTMDVLVSAIWERDEQGRPLRSMAVIEDVTERNRLAQRSHFAEHDPLTGLPNRVLLEDRLGQACQLAQRGAAPFALGFMDLDRFKRVNDTLGHQAGDALLREVAKRLRSTLRESDTLCRLSGDEFVILLHGLSDPVHARRLGQWMIDSLVREPFVLTGLDGTAHRLNVSASMGIALHGPHGRDATTLMRYADHAMYEAKHAGRNAVHLPAVPAPAPNPAAAAPVNVADAAST